MISRIEAYKYRCFQQLDVKVGKYNVLAGVNGSGKSTLLDIPLLLGELLSFGVVKAFLESPSQEDTPRAQSFQDLIYCSRGDSFGLAIETILPQGQNEGKHLRYEIGFQIVNEIELHIVKEQLYIVPGETNEHPQQILTRTQISQQVLIQPENGSPSLDLSLSPQELALANIPRDVTKFSAAVWLRDLLAKGVMRYEPSMMKLRGACSPGQPSIIRPDAANLPWLVMSLQREAPELFAAWVEHLKIALPSLIAIESVRREEDYHAYLRLKYRENYAITSSGLSYGTLQILALTILPYLSKVPSLIFLEEPENGIHPQAIEVVLQSLSSVYDAQVWISTHSPVVLAHTDLDWVIVMRNTKDGGVKAIAGNKHPRLKNWRGSIDLGSLFAAGVLS